MRHSGHIIRHAGHMMIHGSHMIGHVGHVMRYAGHMLRPTICITWWYAYIVNELNFTGAGFWL